MMIPASRKCVNQLTHGDKFNKTIIWERSVRQYYSCDAVSARINYRSPPSHRLGFHDFCNILPIVDSEYSKKSDRDSDSEISNLKYESETKTAMHAACSTIFRRPHSICQFFARALQ